MRYDNGKDWVEIVGVAKKPMRELIALDGDTLVDAHAFAVKVTLNAHFVDDKDNIVNWQDDVLGLSVQQWNWWKGRIWATARDEKIDPEA